MDKVTKETWDSMRPRKSVEALFAAELCHRVANEFAAVGAALAIAKKGAKGRSLGLLEEAQSRVDGFVALHRLLIAPVEAATIDLPIHLEQICLAVAETRLVPLGVSLSLRADACTSDARTAWILSLVASEAMTNAAKHAFHGRGGAILITLGVTAGTVTLRIGDDGPGLTACKPRADKASATAGSGSGIINELASSLGGSATRISTIRGTIVEVIIPTNSCASHTHRYSD